MALSAKVVSFLLTDDVVGTTQAITGVGFQPKAVILFWGGNQSATDSVATQNSHFGMGFGVSSSERGCIAAWVNDNEGTTETACGIRNEQLVMTVDGTDLAVGRWDLVSMDVDGFTIIVDQDASTANSPRVHALCLGGADITNVKVGSFAKAGSTGNQAVTGVGFQPDMLFLLATGEASGFPDSDSAARYCFGAARSAAEQSVIFGYSEDAVGTSNTERYVRFDECVLVRANTGTVNRGTFVSMDSDGFTINWNEGTATCAMLYLAIKGGGWKVGNDLTQTALTTTVTSGYGFTPRGVMVASHCATSQNATPGTPNAQMMISMGAANSPTSRGCQSTEEPDGLGTSDVWNGIMFDGVYQNLTGGAGMVGEMDVQSFDGDGVTFVMDDADPTQRVFWYIGMGDTPVAAEVPSLALLGVGV
jgi:hypothetical protein